MTERRPGVWLARVFVDGSRSARPSADEEGRRKAEVAAGRPSCSVGSASHLGATVPTCSRCGRRPGPASGSRRRYADHAAGPPASSRTSDGPPGRHRPAAGGRGWQMRRRGVGAGAIRGRVSTLKAAASWGVSRRMLRSNPVVDAAPRVRNGRRSVRPEPEQVVALLTAAAEESAVPAWRCGWRRSRAPGRRRSSPWRGTTRWATPCASAASATASAARR